jgi:hypothetical protein
MNNGIAAMGSFMQRRRVANIALDDPDTCTLKMSRGTSLESHYLEATATQLAADGRAQEAAAAGDKDFLVPKV